MVPKAEIYDVVIIGAGVTGTAIARALARRKPHLKIAVLEKEEGVARHTSGRNSGVVHAGFHLKPGSLKARFSVEGSRRIGEFCAQKGVPFKTLGTLVVARSEGELATLEELYRRGQANGVPNLQILPREELQKREPRVKGCAALYAPSGAVVDSFRLVEALAQEACTQGVSFLFGQCVRRLEREASGYHVQTDQQQFKCSYLINAAGLYADHLAHMLGAGSDYIILPFRGEYYLVRERKAQLVRTLVYPVPDLSFPFLGVHFTPTVYGELKVGPNAVPALGREAYTNKQIHVRETLAILFDKRSWRLLRRQEFRRLAARHIRTSLSKRAFLEEAGTLVEGLEEKDLLKGPPAGIRAQLVDREGRLIDDMILEKKGSSLHVLNIVSPGLTCALPFADYIVNML